MQTDIPDDTDQHLEEPANERPLLSVPVAFGLALVFIAVTLGGSYWLVRARNQPSPDEGIPVGTVLAREGTVFPSPTAISTRAPTTVPAATSALLLAQQPTAAAPTSVARSTPLPIAADAATSTPQTITAGAPTSALTTPTVAPATLMETPAPTQAAQSSPAEPATTTEQTSAPVSPPVEIGAGCLASAGVPIEPAREVASAYLNYFQVRADALLSLDPVPLEAVAADDALEGLRADIEESRAAGRATLINVQHHCIVVQVKQDEAVVADIQRDSSIYVDPTTRQPLPGEDMPTSPAEAPTIKVVYRLRKVDSIWKVIGGQEYA